MPSILSRLATTEPVRPARQRLRRIGAVAVAVANGAVVVCVGGPSSDATIRTDGRAAGPPVPRPLPAHLGGTRPTVVLYGDSLAWEAREHFVGAFAEHPHVDVVTRSFGGTAICDWLDTMRTDATQLAPRAVVIEFSGNALTDCMRDGAGRPVRGEEYLRRYRDDAVEAMAIFGAVGASVTFAGAPGPRPVAGHDDRDRLDDRLRRVYLQVASANPDVAEFVDTGAAVLDEGRWTATMPCLPGEPCQGGFDDAGRPVNVVRAPDGTHFCPGGEPADEGRTGPCPVWSSGAYRFGTAMAAAVLRDRAGGVGTRPAAAVTYER
jgi:hypothetical protein